MKPFLSSGPSLGHSRWSSVVNKRAGLLALAAAAAATAAWVQWQARRAERDNPPAGKYIYVDGVRLHYVTRGEGPPVLLIHGNNVTHADFEASGLIDELARNHQVIAFDRPGYGHSSRPRDRLWTAAAQAAILHRALAGLGIQRPVVFGHSMGAAVAMAMALDFPAGVSSLVLAGGYFYPTMRYDALLAAPGALPVVGDAMRYTSMPLMGRLMLERLVKGMFAPCDVPEDFLRVVPREMLLRPVQLRANAEDAAFMMPQARALSRRYDQLRLPVTIIAGSEDKVVALDAHPQRFHDEIPHSVLQVLPGVGHMVHHAAREQVIAAIENPGSALGRTAILQESDQGQVQGVDHVKQPSDAGHGERQLAHQHGNG